jgi:hypothetical protein
VHRPTVQSLLGRSKDPNTGVGLIIDSAELARYRHIGSETAPCAHLDMPDAGRA